MRDPRLVGTVKLPTIEDAVKAGGFLAGRPEDIIEALKALDVQLADLDRFGKRGDPGLPRHPHRRRRTVVA